MVRRDPVTPTLRLFILDRDNGCVAVRLGEDPATCAGRLEIDHIDGGGLGRRGPSTLGNCVALCSYHHRQKTEHARTWRPRLREYVQRVTLPCSEHDVVEIDRLLELLRPDMEAHPEEYTIEALERRHADWLPPKDVT